jgi:hypothetical protein
MKIDERQQEIRRLNSCYTCLCFFSVLNGVECLFILYSSFHGSLGCGVYISDCPISCVCDLCGRSWPKFSRMLFETVWFCYAAIGNMIDILTWWFVFVLISVMGRVTGYYPCICIRFVLFFAVRR